ncbi:MAG TPA: alkaline shock response membrane anchor protein AmaP [Bacillota bacterium]|nr:alkaline shock response membrane anchor protein AmaP [Bacillota bacterium]HOB87168.1 alkaline shock response membrane anchor protein AmaP [Bacillota bacterium]HOP68943.1 alkaline shock response membrane anchor protein AmaP [Bacillota bacterium]HPT33909.1 alkaline shock response membrane anchor protein AmaP [Bacillota bacterium]HQD06145.1 alkaline shock response membrane anchor protein AmaP [Bacillota bacterium]
MATRFVLVVVGLLLIGLALFVLGVSLQLLPDMGTGFAWLTGWQYALAGGVILVVALLLVSLALRTDAKRRPPDTVLVENDFGEVRISLTAIENMVHRVAQQQKGVKDNSRKVNVSPQGLIVYLTVRVMPDLELPALVSELQEKIKNYIEKITGIVVFEVKVKIENIIVDQVALKR